MWSSGTLFCRMVYRSGFAESKKAIEKIYHLLLLCEHLVCTYNVLVDILLEHRYISIEIRNVYLQVMHFLAFGHWWRFPDSVEEKNMILHHMSAQVK